jgi:hypothetical protein
MEGNMAQKTKKSNELEEREEDVLDILLDENNDSPITLFDENEKAVKFEQVAIIPDN